MAAIIGSYLTIGRWPGHRSTAGRVQKDIADNMEKSLTTRIKDLIWHHLTLIQSNILAGPYYRNVEILGAERKEMRLIKQEKSFDHKKRMSFELIAAFELIEPGEADSYFETVAATIEAEVRIYDTVEGTPAAVKILKVSNGEIEKQLALKLPFLAGSAEQYVGAVLEEAREFHISEKYYPTITEYVTFRYQRTNAETCVRHPEIMGTYYNLLLYGEDAEQIMKFANKLSDFFRGTHTVNYVVEEKEAIESFDTGVKGRVAGNFDARWEQCDTIHICDCQPQPFLNEDAGTGAAREESVKKATKYRNFWNHVVDFTKKHPEVSLIVSMSEYVYKDSFLKNNELNYRIFSHKICIPEITMEQALKMALYEFHSSSFTLAPDFEEEFTRYVHTIYQRAELKGVAFAEDAVNRVYALHFSRHCAEEKPDVLTAKCIPRYRKEIRTAEDVLSKLNALTGLQSVKETFDGIYKKQLADPENAKKGSYHMMFYGNPGTGKTTVARLTAELLWQCGVLKTRKCVEATVGDLTSVYKNGTSAKVRSKIQQALDGVLIIDEAYGLANGTESAAEALNILIQEMLNYQDRLVVILAGYEDKMEELMKKNSGLSSRIAYKIRFEDFSVEELKQIFEQQCRQSGFTLDESAEETLEECLEARKLQEFFGNGRDVANLLQEVQGSWSKEYYELVKKYGKEKAELPKILYKKHFLDVMPAKNEPTIENMIGLESVKKQLEKFRTQVKYFHAIKEMGMKKMPEPFMHMLFMGNPGTGKTTVAKMIANDLYSLGVLKTNRLVAAERKDIINPFGGETAKQVNELINKAIGGVLFIDEAYALAEAGEAGREAVETILTAMVDHKEDTIFVFAGYPAEMRNFLEMNPGIPSRIGYTFRFEDYNTEELIRIFKKQMEEAGFVVAEEVYPKVGDIMEYFCEMPKFGNGRFVEQLISRIIANRSEREYTKENYNRIEVCDIPEIGELIETNSVGIRLHDPKKISEESRLRTAYHELGHAIAIYELHSAMEIEKISIKSRAFSLGRVSLKENGRNRTEEELQNEIAILLAGRCAERVFCGSCDEGCISDYERAKKIADNMLNLYGMCEIGVTKPEDLLRQGDQYATEIIQKYQHCIEKIARELLTGREFTGEEFVSMITTV